MEGELSALYRRERGQLLATVARLVGDLDRAEEIVQEAWLRATDHWRGGLPENPGAWLTTVAKRLAIDEHRARRRWAPEAVDVPGADAEDIEAQVERALAPELLRDDPLRLLFVCCHPLLPPESQVALTLRTLGGLGTPEVARAFLRSETAVGQRIHRAKRLLRERAVPYRVPSAWELPERVPSVLDVIYLIFNEGYAAREGESPVRHELCEEALRLAALMSEGLRDVGEIHGLHALLLFQASRLHARTDAQGAIVLLADQDRRSWDQARIAAGDRELERARRSGHPGRFVLQAEIAACHAQAASFEATDWGAIVDHYDALLARAPSPVVALNRAVAVGRASGPAAGLAALDAVADDPRLAGYPWLPAARADCLERLGRSEEAAQTYEAAADATENAAEAELLRRRAADCRS
ncbi:MAG: sigma-70 family RNA polymerase sigma factor [Myxococcota bacterium]